MISKRLRMTKFHKSWWKREDGRTKECVTGWQIWIFDFLSERDTTAKMLSFPRFRKRTIALSVKFCTSHKKAPITISGTIVTNANRLIIWVFDRVFNSYKSNLESSNLRRKAWVILISFHKWLGLRNGSTKIHQNYQPTKGNFRVRKGYSGSK